MARILVSAAILFASAACSNAMHEQRPMQSSSELTEALEGKAAGDELACVSLHELDGQTLFPREGAVLFEGPGSTVYLNRFDGGCTSLGTGLALQLATPTGRICRGEIAQIFDPTAGISHGACIFGPFVPYRNSR